MKYHPLDFEDEFHRKDRKIFRKERAIARTTDRSQFKKTDLDQQKKRIKPPDKEQQQLQEGRVLSYTADGVVVDVAGTRVACNVKGSLKKQIHRVKNIIAIGDIVLISSHNDNQGTIVWIKDRKTELSRLDPYHPKNKQLIATNVDQVMITMSAMHPPLCPSLIDRYLIAAHKGGMETLVIINKIDLLNDPETPKQVIDLFFSFVRIYHSLGIAIYPVSTLTREGISALAQAMEGKSSVLTGPSGTGKTSLVNILLGLSLPTGNIAKKTGRGTHKTTMASLIPLKGGGFCVDTPGISSFGLWDLSKRDILDHFFEFRTLKTSCLFPDCFHLSEPSCAVKEGLRTGVISSLRFTSYCTLMEPLSRP